MILTIARKELFHLFRSPLAWTLLAAVQLIAAWLFLSQIDLFVNLQSQLGGVTGALSVDVSPRPVTSASFRVSAGTTSNTSPMTARSAT